MNLQVVRKWLDAKATQGELFVDGVHEAYTLEPPVRSDNVKPRAIPDGTYRVTWAFSPRHQKFLPLINDVPGFSGVEMHVGNYPKDTEACLLVGTTKADDAVFGSTQEFNSLAPRIKEACDAGDVFITYTTEPDAT